MSSRLTLKLVFFVSFLTLHFNNNNFIQLKKELHVKKANLQLNLQNLQLPNEKWRAKFGDDNFIYS